MKTMHAGTPLLPAVFLLCLVLSAGHRAASSEPLSCRGRSRLTYSFAPSASNVGDVIRVGIVLGAGEIVGGTALSVRRVRFNLDCDGSSMGINCSDDGPVVSYQGALTTTCPSVTFTASHAAGEALPNQVVFTSSSPILIPAGTESYCGLEFDVRIETASHDGTHDAIEQIAGFNAATGDGVCNTTPPLGASDANTGRVCLGAACRTSETTCEVFEELTYPATPRRVTVGSVLRPHISLGAGHNGGEDAIIKRFRFDLDCNGSNLGMYCADDGAVMSYQGSITSTCGVSWTASHAPGDMFPNQVVFTPSLPITIPADAADFCSLEFSVRVEGRGSDGTPDAIEQVCGLDAAMKDASCLSGTLSASGDAEAGSLGLIPICDDGNPCNGLEVYDGDACVSGPPLDCDDANSCTADSCDPLQGCAHWGNGSCRSNPKEPGYWKRLCRTSHASAQDSFTAQDVDCVNNACTFSSVATTADLCARLDPAPPSDKCEQAEARFMALMLNVCRGRVPDAETVHSGCGVSTTVREARALADTRLCDAARSSATCSQTPCAPDETNESRIGR